MELDIGGGLGDQLAATATVREYSRAFPDENIRLVSQHEVWKHNRRLGVGNRENGRTVRFNFFRPVMVSFPYDFAEQIGDATGDRFSVVDDSPEIFLTDEERRSVLPSVKHPAAAIDTYAGWVTRRWGRDSYVRLARLMIDDGWSVFEVGGNRRPKFSPLGFVPSVVGLLKLRPLAEFLRRMDLYVGNDSGLMHLAAAVGTPQVVVFGIVPAAKRAYRTTIPVSHAAPCASKCSWGACRRGTFCMDEIGVDQVLEATRKILAVARG